MWIEQDHFVTALSDICLGHEALRPPRRMRVSEAVGQTLVLKTPGGVSTPWSADETPYIVEPMDMLASRRHEAVCFIGPARTGKTAGLLLGGMGYAVVHDPGDMLMIQMTQDKAREFSKTDVARAIANSPAIAAMRSTHASDDNTHDKMFRNGMWLRIAWPTASNVAGSTYRYVFITDLDRMANADNVDGEGPLFNLALKRTQTFLSRGMCLVETSPGREIVDPNWRAATPHEAPPTGGGLGIYNLSDRRRWYWRCLDCHDPFEAAPGLSLFALPPERELIETVRTDDIARLSEHYNRLVCPHCGSIIAPKWKRELNRQGRWVAEGQHLTPEGEIIGAPVASTIAGYWLGGVAAAYQSWKSIIGRYLQGLRSYALTGSEEVLKATTNTDQGAPYMPRHLAEANSGRLGPRGRKEPDLERYVVPPQARFVTAHVDVQGGQDARFVVQVHAHGPHHEEWIVDRREIRFSPRGADDAPVQIDPASYGEDWDVLTDQVVRATYRTAEDGQEIAVLRVTVDTGGEDGVTMKAYEWYRRLRREGLHRRVYLLKGASAKGAPLVVESWVGARKGKDQGDIPLYLYNPNLLKDEVNNVLRRTEPGPGYMHFPDWLSDRWFDELEAEVRTPGGSWKKVRKRNEAWDLCVAARVAKLLLKVDKIRWDSPPPWAAPLAQNSERMTRDERREMQGNPIVALAPQDPAEGQRRPAGRRRSSSTYLR